MDKNKTIFIQGQKREQHSFRGQKRIQHSGDNIYKCLTGIKEGNIHNKKILINIKKNHDGLQQLNEWPGASKERGTTKCPVHGARGHIWFHCHGNCRTRNLHGYGNRN